MKNEVIDINHSTIKRYVESKRPENLEIRKQLDLAFSYDGQIIELFEIRPMWNNPKEIQNILFAKIRFSNNYGICIGCELAENGNYINHFQIQLI